MEPLTDYDDMQLSEVDKISRAKWRTQAETSELFNSKTLDNFDSRKQPIAHKVIKNYDLIGGVSVIFSSPDIYGVGKTHLAYALINRFLTESPAAYTTAWGCVVSSSIPVYFSTENKLLSRIRMTYQDGAPENEEMIYNTLRSKRMIIIDDVGKVKPRDYNFLQNVYFRIIDDRYNDKKAIMITTNLDFKNLESHIGGASADRLHEMCSGNIVKMTGTSQRVPK